MRLTDRGLIVLIAVPFILGMLTAGWGVVYQ